MGIAVQRIGEITFPIIQKRVDEIVMVNEDDIAYSHPPIDGEKTDRG